jgi:polyhydroxyalkanoate synthesis regulator phasin
VKDSGEGVNFDSWKENWKSLSKSGKILLNDFSKKLSETGQQISVASSKAASQAKDSFEEQRQRIAIQKIMDEIDVILAISNQTPVDDEEVARLRLRVATLEVKQKELEKLITDMENLVDIIPKSRRGKHDEDKNSNYEYKNTGFFDTIKQTPTLIGFAVLWTLILVVSGKYVEDIELVLFGYSAVPYVWVIGAMIWSYVVLTQVSNVGSFTNLPLAFRVQSTLGVGVATTTISILPEIENMSAMFNVFSWLVMVALTILVVSAIMNGYKSLKK